MSATHVVFTSPESPLANGATRDLKVELRDDLNETDFADSTTHVTFAQVDGLGQATGLGTVAAVAGVATLTITASNPGPVTIQATTDTALPPVLTAFMVAAAATHLVFTSDASALAPGATRALVAEARDDNDTVDPTFVGNVTFALDGTSTGTVTGLGVVAAVAGVATLTATGGVAGAVIVNATAAGLTGGSSSFSVAAPDVAPPVPEGEYDPHTWTPKEAENPTPERLNAIEQTLSEVVGTALGTQGDVASVQETLAAILALSITLRSAEHGSRLEEDAAGIRFYDHENVLTIDFNTEKGSGYFAGDVLARNLRYTAITDSKSTSGGNISTHAYNPIGLSIASEVDLTITGDNMYTVGGIVGGTEGRSLLFRHMGTLGVLAFEHEDTGAAVGDRIALPGGGPWSLYMREGDVVEMRYTNGRWRVGDVQQGGMLQLVNGYAAFTLAANTNNLDPEFSGSGAIGMLWLTAFGNFDLTGVKRGSETKRLDILNGSGSTGNITLKHNSANSAAGNRFNNIAGRDIVLRPGQMATYQFGGGFGPGGSGGWNLIGVFYEIGTGPGTVAAGDDARFSDSPDAKEAGALVVTDPTAFDFRHGLDVVQSGTEAQVNVDETELTNRFATLLVPQAANPAQTADGSVVWDSDDDLLTIGDGTSRKTFQDRNRARAFAFFIGG